MGRLKQARQQASLQAIGGLQASCNLPLPWSYAGWFTLGIVTQTMVVHLIRTARIPFLQEARPCKHWDSLSGN